MAAAMCIQLVGNKSRHILLLQRNFLLKSLRCAPNLLQQQKADSSSKHYDIKWRKLRKAKVKKVELPDFEGLQRDEKMTPDEMRIKMKKEGKLPPRTFLERPINLASTGGIFEPYVPPEGDGKSSAISKEGAKQRLTELEKRGKSFMEMRKLRKYEENFTAKSFAEHAQNIYVQVHKLMEDVTKNEDQLHDLVSEKAYPEMMFGLKLKSLRWNFIESLEPPTVVHIRTTELMGKENLYSQVTVRLHTKQTLSIYDRFGRLMFGSEVIAKDILEYVVFEKHIVNEYGVWRIHGKVVPPWMPPREPLIKTYRKPEHLLQDPPSEVSEETKQSEVVSQPELATA